MNGDKLYNFGETNNFPKPSKKMLAHFEAASTCLDRNEEVLDVFYGTLGDKKFLKPAKKYATVITNKRIIMAHDTLKGGYDGRIAKYMYLNNLESVSFKGKQIQFTDKEEEVSINVESNNYNAVINLITSLIQTKGA